METTVKKTPAVKKPAIKLEHPKEVIDATDQIMGRLATRIATLLQGKDQPGYLPYLDTGAEVQVTNVAQMKVTGNKMEDKKYYHHSGYPGGLKTKLMKELTPAQRLQHAVSGMLPKNKLRAPRLKRLKIT